MWSSLAIGSWFRVGEWGEGPLFCGELATGSVVVVIAVGRMLLTRMVELN